MAWRHGQGGGGRDGEEKSGVEGEGCGRGGVEDDRVARAVVWWSGYRMVHERRLRRRTARVDWVLGDSKWLMADG